MSYFLVDASKIELINENTILIKHHMKKLISLATLICLFAAFSFAQETENILKTKKGRVIMPEVGDIGLSVDATPFLNYAGNMFSQGFNTAPNFGFTAQNPGSITVKYFMQSNMALRVGLIIGSSRAVVNAPNFTDPDKLDKTVSSSSTLGLSLGAEFNRPIKNRLRGYYGGEVGLGYFAHPDGKIAFTDAVTADNDVLTKGGNTIEIYAAGLIGVEYFVAPKISLGGEFLVGMAFGSQSARKMFINDPALIEAMDTDEIVISEKSSAMALNTVASGAIKLSFYF